MNKKQKIIISVIILAIALLVYYFYTNSNNENVIVGSENLLIKNENETSNNSSNTELEDIFVYVSGAVNYPGVIQMKSNGRVKDAIEIAGGLKENADLTNINLAEILEDESKIYIPEQGESQITKEVEGTDEKMNNQEKEKLSININTANNEELQKLPGIGSSTANKIIDYRKQNGKFSSIEDIKKVSGIGENKFNKIKEYIKVK